MIEVIMILLAALLSFKTTDKSIRRRNHFTWGAIQEVAVLFIGIFGQFSDANVVFFDPQFITAELCGGGLMLGAWFMATDYVTSPITKSGQIVYGIVLGLLTGLFRLFGGSSEGVSYAIIISNLLVPLIEKVTLPKPFGKGGEK